MSRRSVQLLFSLIIIIGVGIGYFAAKDFRKQVNHVYAAVSISMVSVGVLFLIRAYLAERSAKKKAELAARAEAAPKAPTHFTLLEQNNNLVKEWNEIDEKREKLKMLEMADVQ